MELNEPIMTMAHAGTGKPLGPSALSRGVLVGRGPGIVHSVFAQAVNIGFAENRVVVLLDGRRPNVPHGIRIAPHAWAQLHDSVQAGDECTLCDHELCFPGRALRVALGGACVWRLDLAVHSLDWSDARVLMAHAAAQAGLRRYTDSLPRHDLMRARFSRRMTTVLPALELALRTLHAEQAGMHLNALIGLGCGLTPSGDDFIIGCLAGLAVGTRGDTVRAAFARRLAGSLERAGTTLISRQHLSDACHLQFAQPLAELTVAIAGGGCDVGQRLNAALGVGAYSGADGVAGLLFALQARRDQAAPIAVH
jgi:hypothetical protein